LVPSSSSTARFSQDAAPSRAIGQTPERGADRDDLGPLLLIDRQRPGVLALQSLIGRGQLRDLAADGAG
jgi:hypothetical protein